MVADRRGGVSGGFICASLMQSAVSGQISLRLRQFLVVVGVIMLAAAGQAAAAPSAIPTLSGVLARSCRPRAWRGDVVLRCEVRASAGLIAGTRKPRGNSPARLFASFTINGQTAASTVRPLRPSACGLQIDFAFGQLRQFLADRFFLAESLCSTAAQSGCIDFIKKPRMFLNISSTMAWERLSRPLQQQPHSPYAAGDAPGHNMKRA